MTSAGGRCGAPAFRGGDCRPRLHRDRTPGHHRGDPARRSLALRHALLLRRAPGRTADRPPPAFPHRTAVPALPDGRAGRAGGVDRWFFIRYADPHPHLRLRLHGEPALLNGVLLPRLHDLAGELARAGLARGLRIDGYSPETERYGGAALLEAAEEVFHADSLLVLERLAVPEDDRILSAAHDVAELVRAFHDGYGGDWRQWLTATYAKREQHHKAFAARRRAALARITRDGGPDAVGAPYRAAPRRFGRLVREEEERGTLSVTADAVLASLVHMHCNRRLGTDRTAEVQALAVARGAVQAQLDRERARS
ncbi:thiopeptide-type bacteriocin biosynthesis protein [Streptomyces sp. Tu 6176]|uniref:thiopeptide-type bacteriocin biosynthesis protein n=1 Tax=Streptomyces sp. Tu 6176 TaxID=1470557 RepID=UPI002D21BDB4|nr:thiopeptide-type bacteriocin biosynthesis protein [Streptomyces sp. Tu 6176]